MSYRTVSICMDSDTYVLLRFLAFARQSKTINQCARDLVAERLSEIVTPAERARILCSPVLYQEPS
jgi:hypothetical protein